MASGSKQLLDLPGDVQVQVLGNLGVRDVARTLRSCHALAQLAQGQSPLWREVLVRECGLDLADGARARGVLRQLRETRTARIHFVGVLTDGGIDSPYTPGAEDDEPSLPSGNPASLGERDLQYWVTSMFLPVPWLIYCSASGRTDILCAATLVGYYDEYGEAQEQSRRDYMLERLALIAGEQWNMTIDGFGGLSSASPEVLDEAFFAASEMDIQLLLHGPHLEKGAHLLKIRRLRAQIQQKWSLRRARGASLLCTLRAENGRTAVFAPQEEEASPSSPCAVLSRLTVRRPVSCSCPASHGVIFASRERIDGVALLDCPTLDAACAQLLILPGGWAGSAGSGSVEHIEGVGHVVRRTALAEGEILEVIIINL
ncbi:hypothetical protein T492DRAFT_268035 [Pavlovales sp. CCMP2436]|nr:hypothetical protein T492DRAFT_268035 [Pavlovales sp. CCMP2436]